MQFQRFQAVAALINAILDIIEKLARKIRDGWNQGRRDKAQAKKAKAKAARTAAKATKSKGKGRGASKGTATPSKSPVRSAVPRWIGKQLSKVVASAGHAIVRGATTFAKATAARAAAARVAASRAGAVGAARSLRANARTMVSRVISQLRARVAVLALVRGSFARRAMTRQLSSARRAARQALAKAATRITSWRTAAQVRLRTVIRTIASQSRPALSRGVVATRGRFGALNLSDLLLRTQAAANRAAGTLDALRVQAAAQLTAAFVALSFALSNAFRGGRTSAGATSPDPASRASSAASAARTSASEAPSQNAGSKTGREQAETAPKGSAASPSRHDAPSAGRAASATGGADTRASQPWNNPYGGATQNAQAESGFTKAGNSGTQPVPQPTTSMPEIPTSATPARARSTQPRIVNPRPTESERAALFSMPVNGQGLARYVGGAQRRAGSPDQGLSRQQPATGRVVGTIRSTSRLEGREFKQTGRFNGRERQSVAPRTR